jgi:hypothetical protein
MKGKITITEKQRNKFNEMLDTLKITTIQQD